MRRVATIVCGPIIIALMAVMVSGCGLCKPRKSTDTQVVTNTVYKETLRDTTIYIRSEHTTTVMDTAGMANILSQLKGGKDTLYIYSKSGAAVQKYYLDKKGNLNADCEASERRINMLLKEIDRLRESSSDKTVTITPSWWDRHSVHAALGLIMIGALALFLWANSILK